MDSGGFQNDDHAERECARMLIANASAKTKKK